MSAHLKMGSNTEQVHLLGQTEQCMMANGLITSVMAKVIMFGPTVMSMKVTGRTIWPTVKESFK